MVDSLNSILESKAYGYTFWDTDKDGRIEACEFYEFMSCFGIYLECNNGLSFTENFEAYSEDCSMSKNEWKKFVKEVCDP